MSTSALIEQEVESIFTEGNDVNFESTENGTLQEIVGKFHQFRDDLSAGLLERAEEIDCLLTSAINGTNVLFVSPPGTAKSMLCELFAKWINGNCFEILMTKYTTPEEVFGPQSLKGLENDEFYRVTSGMLPEAHVAFLDEFWKASSAIRNATLRILNERKFKNGTSEVRCPLITCMAASNEWGNDTPGDSVDSAAFDRFLVRKKVQKIRSPHNVEKLLWGLPEVRLSGSITSEEIRTASEASRSIPWEDEARNAFISILAQLDTDEIRPGDRRCRQSAMLCQSTAVLDGVNSVGTEQMRLLEHTLWEDPDTDINKVAAIVKRIAQPLSSKLKELEDAARDAMNNLKPGDKTAPLTAMTTIREIRAKAGEMGNSKAVQETLARLTDMAREVANRYAAS